MKPFETTDDVQLQESLFIYTEGPCFNALHWQDGIGSPRAPGGSRVTRVHAGTGCVRAPELATNSGLPADLQLKETTANGLWDSFQLNRYVMLGIFH